MIQSLTNQFLWRLVYLLVSWQLHVGLPSLISDTTPLVNNLVPCALLLSGALEIPRI